MSESNRAEGIQGKMESKVGNLGKGKYGRILKMAHTPTKDESVADMEKSAKKEPETPPFTAPTSRDEDELF